MRITSMPTFVSNSSSGSPGTIRLFAPTQVFIRQGQQVDQLSGANPVALEDAIKRNLSSDGSGVVETDSIVPGQV
jgi:hypothetical protein